MIIWRYFMIVAVVGVLSACQAGHPYSRGGYYARSPQSVAPNSPRPIPVPKNKPTRSVKATKPIKTRPATVTTIVVRKGDGLYALSRRHGVLVRVLIEYNNLKPPYRLYPGQKLKRPAKTFHVVQAGETVYSLSRHYGVDETTFVRMNKLKRPYLLGVGQRLTVPGAAARKSGPAVVWAKEPLPPPQSGNGFLWPIKGKLLSSFGAKAMGYHNDGINISARLNSYVRAAQNGVVVHAGQKIKGYGRLVLIRHAGGWITAYAHNSAVLVRKGQTVKRGQAIARVGQSGGVSRPQLHFEMRKGARAVNPIAYLKS